MGLRNGMGFYLKSLEERSPSSTWAEWGACRGEQKEAKDETRVQSDGAIPVKKE